jgi:hypothetical protein
MNPDSTNGHRSSSGGALTVAIERGEWERIVLHMFMALTQMLRSDHGATIDDLIDLLESARDADGT